MKASILDLRRRTKEILRALDRNESVSIFYRGKCKGTVLPSASSQRPAGRAADHPAFGMWKDRKDLDDTEGFVRRLREGRRHAL